MKRLLVAAIALLVIVVQAATFLTIATGGTAGTYYPLGAGMADIWNKNIKGMNAMVQSTGASVANVNLLKNKEVDLIFVQNDVAFYAYNGVEMFKEPFPQLRGLATLYPETVQIVALADRGINSVYDLKGKRVAVGAAGSGTEVNARQILAAAGITYNDIKVQYLSFAEAANNLKDGNIDAAFVTAGHPTAAIVDLAAVRKIVLVPVPDEIIASLQKDYPFYVKIVVPAGTYKGVDVDVITVAVKAMLAVRAEMPEDLAYQLLKTMYANQKRLIEAHAKGELIIPETGKEGMSIPLHPGAEKFFKEMGL
ncbi:C4-dicarboxylate ABC transporter substrate-binding protein [Pseudothermotoga hypogea DSM 11164 = NBRC 106472]|uniref:C4-dicarboxylate ABC transporter substrate-binding protein n=1 Tax=Pseudothermotoga hypogea DSM 11164 = NBRC 106472 TaxID=1123384 RepID=A0A0X1KSM3_9THEM|nr:TAXI family TRAP transporter solute-binding subunit [Pseudothermotoga hypogea]AJC74320.1 C4-dicarboxylate ABC transporter substrate-binding protein [Pseudothermotoga hypogea DSM 11164 = NBRC 106472]MBC7123676.1 TAXI family TRAP transporter solute-binding subunit [Pseudothermotoga sp.]